MLTSEEVETLCWMRGYLQGDLTTLQSLGSQSPAVTVCLAGIEQAMTRLDTLLRRHGVTPEDTRRHTERLHQVRS